MALASPGRRLAALCARNARCVLASSGVTAERRVENWHDHSRAFHAGSGGGRDGPRRSNFGEDALGSTANAAFERGRATTARARAAWMPHRRDFHGSSPRDAKDYYQTLGVAKSADPKEIKKAYYDLAKKYHPDANKDDPTVAAKFQEVQKAYEVLKDPAQRQTYDQVGHGNFESMENGGGGGGGPFGGGFSGFHGFGGAGGGQQVDFEDLFSDFFGGMGGMRGGARDIQTTIRVTLREVKEGAARTVRIPETVAVDPRTGARTTEPARDVEVNLPPGVEDGQRLRVPGEGTRARGPDGRERVGSLYINVDVAEDPRFARIGNDLVTRVELGVTAAALGGVATAPTLDGKVEVKVRKATQSGDQLRLRGRGLPELGTGRTGDLFVKFRVVTPKHLSPRQTELLREFAEEEERKKNPEPRLETKASEDPAEKEPKEKERAESA
jgi:DnaJ-class molecular chaperone